MNSLATVCEEANMERKFLAFSCLVLLISIVYFIYTSYRLHTENKNQQEMVVELEEPFVGVGPSSFSQPQPESSNLESTEGEWEAFEGKVKDFESFGEITETTQLEGGIATEISETEDVDTEISSELEEMFIYYKGYLERRRKVSRKIAHLMRQFVELDERIEELGNLIIETTNRGEEHQELVEERQQLYEDKDEVSIALEPHDKHAAQLDQEWEEYLQTYHGIDSTTFRETHAEDLRSWLANQ